MSRFLWLAGVLAAVAGLSAVPIARVAACSCMQMSPEAAVAAVSAAFTGTVMHEDPMTGSGFGGTGAEPVGDIPRDAPLPMPAIAPDQGAMLYRFEVDGVAKGELGTQATLLGGGDGAGCGMSFAVGQRWLIFANVEGDVLTTSLCAGNVLLEPGQEPPLPVTAPTASPGADGSGFTLPMGVVVPVAVIAALVGVSAYIFWRADRPS